jgi:hypothetical protein
MCTQGGNIRSTGVSVVVNSSPADAMSFTVTFGVDEPPRAASCNDGIQNGDEAGMPLVASAQASPKKTL